MSLPKTRLVIALILASIFLVSPALSHGNLQSAKPAPGETVRHSPEKIELTFNEDIQSGTINLVRTGGSAIPLTLLETDQPDMLIARVDDSLKNGEYSVLWVATSADDHTISGSHNFAVEISNDEYVFYIIGGIALMLLIAGYMFMQRQPIRADSTLDTDQV